MPCCHDGLLLHAVVACWRRRLAHHWRTVLSISAGLTLTVAGCATPRPGRSRGPPRGGAPA